MRQVMFVVWCWDWLFSLIPDMQIERGEKLHMPLCGYFMLGLVLIFTFLLGMHYLLFSCWVFFFLNRGFSNELGM